ncbi:MAG: general secretion pathway protein GspD, partial [Proteobacteria bacterium]|nr:general secretion pathway protein GspD [Pseudomonadota bacterium]
MKKICICFVIAALAGCSAPVSKRETYDLINAEMTKAATPVKTNPAQPEAVSAALLPPITLTMPKPRQPQEERFSLAFNSVPAQQFFMSLVTGTRYSMLVHPDVS